MAFASATSTSRGHRKPSPTPSPTHGTRRCTRSTQTDAVLVSSASHALSSVLNDLLAVVLQDDAESAAQWATTHAHPRSCALASGDSSVEAQVDELLLAVLRLKKRAALAEARASARALHDGRQRAAAVALDGSSSDDSSGSPSSMSTHDAPPDAVTLVLSDASQGGD